jgi:hypothetical protein
VSMKISKSKFCAGVQCLKRLYLLVHSPELGAQPDSADQAIIEQGREVGMLARQMFPSGVEVRGDGRLDEAIRATRELIDNPEVPAIFEGAFEHGGVFVRVDIFHRRRDGRWNLIEVKSTTDLKDHHVGDVAIQHRVVTLSRIDLASSCLARVNRDYIYQGGAIDVHRFFRIRNLTRQVESLQPELTVQLRSEFLVLVMPAAPNVSVGEHCNNPSLVSFLIIAIPRFLTITFCVFPGVPPLKRAHH